MNARSKERILVVANDAGGAEVLAAYMLAHRKRFDFICYANGPAKGVMKRNAIVFRTAPKKRELIASILKRYSNAKLVLTGTGWMTDIEVNFLAEARRLCFPTAALIDHWVNYRERFGFPQKDWQKNLPDQIWVSDSTAFEMAKKLFPQKIKIKQIPNFYLLAIAREYRTLKRKMSDGKSLLFLSEPLGGVAGTPPIKPAHRFSEFQALRDVLSVVVTFKKPIPVMIRFHPSEKQNKYDNLIERYSDKIKITKSANREIINDIAQAKLVIGMTSMSLIVSLACDKKTISYVAKGGEEGIVSAKNLVKVKTYSALCSSMRTFICRIPRQLAAG